MTLPQITASKPVSGFRRLMTWSCIGLACALWWLARYRPGLVDGWPVWPWYAWAWIGVLSSVLSDDSAGRRAHLTAAVALLLALAALPWWQLALAEFEGQSGAANARSLWAVFLDVCLRQARAWWPLGWVDGISRMPWYDAILVLAAGWTTQASIAQQPMLPRWTRGVGWFGLLGWMVVSAWFVGGWLNGLLHEAPIWFWLLLIVLLPLQWRTAHGWLAIAAWIACLAALGLAALEAHVDVLAVRDGAFAIVLAASALVCLVWYWRMNAIAQFNQMLAGAKALKQAQETGEAGGAAVSVPAQAALADRSAALDARLDDPDAQEGADKYTRE